MQHWLTTHSRVVLILIVFLAFITRLYRVDLPQRYVFDEVYHAVTAKLISQNDVRAYEWWNPPPEPDTAVDWLHPPLAKYTQAVSIKIFGENTLGWRFSSVIFGVLVVVAVYALTEELFNKKSISLLATFLATIDGLLLVQSRIAMNDIHVSFFILLTLLLYLRYLKRRAILIKTQKLGRVKVMKTIGLGLLVAVSAGLAMGSKWSGLFALLIIIVSEVGRGLSHLWLVYDQKLSPAKLWQVTRLLLVNLVFLIVIPWIIYVASYAHMFLQGKSLFCHKQEAIQGECYYEQFKWRDQVVYEGYVSHFVELHRQIWWYQTNLKADHPYESRPIQWFFNLKPVWYHVEYGPDEKITNIYALGNPVLFWLGDLAVAVSLGWLAFMTWRWLNNKKIPPATVSLTFLLLSYFLVWLPWQLSPRIMFFYHYTPAVPLLSIILSFWLVTLWTASKSAWPKLVAYLAVLSIVVCFGLWYSHWTAMPVSREFSERLYFRLSSWK